MDALRMFFFRGKLEGVLWRPPPRARHPPGSKISCAEMTPVPGDPPPVACAECACALTPRPPRALRCAVVQAE